MIYQGLSWKINKSGFEKRITSDGSRKAEMVRRWNEEIKSITEGEPQKLRSWTICSEWEEICSPLWAKYMDLLKSTVRVDIQESRCQMQLLSLFVCSLPLFFTWWTLTSFSKTMLIFLHETLIDPQSGPWFLTTIRSPCNIHSVRI